MTDTRTDKFIKIWKEVGGVDVLKNKTYDEIKELANKPAQCKIDTKNIKYGNYCGPGTVSFDKPIVDCLDLCCYYHDTNFGPSEVDVAFVHAVNYFDEEKLILSSGAQETANIILNPWFPVTSRVYASRRIIFYTILIIIMFALVATMKAINMRFFNYHKKVLL